MIEFLLFVIAIGVLLCSDVGRALLSVGVIAVIVVIGLGVAFFLLVLLGSSVSEVNWSNIEWSDVGGELLGPLAGLVGLAAIVGATGVVRWASKKWSAVSIVVRGVAVALCFSLAAVSLALVVLFFWVLSQEFSADTIIGAAMGTLVFGTGAYALLATALKTLRGLRSTAGTGAGSDLGR